MAVAIPKPHRHHNSYMIAETKLQDHVLDILGNRENDVDFRPTLADQHKVGFFTLDRCSQTDVTEVVDLKEMTEIIQILLQDVATLRRDINLTKHVMQADYESKLQEKAVELYCRINEKMVELERVHQDRVTTVRRAFRQQLSDAIARVAVLYNKNLESKMRSEKSKRAGEKSKQDEHYKELKATIARNEQVIQMLKMQLAHYQQEKTDELESPEPSDRISSTSPTSPMSPIEELSVKSKSPTINIELDEMRDEVDNLNKKIYNLETTIDTKEEKITSLTQEIDQLSKELNEEKTVSTQLKNETEEMKRNAMAEQASSKKLSEEMNSGMEKQKQEMQRMMEEKMRLAREAALDEAQKEASKLQEAEKDRLNQLMMQKRELEEMLRKEKKKNLEKSREESDADKLRKNEQRLKDEINRLKKEIDRVNRTWEKKFAILQQSLHALKDESYIRQTLQRQAAALHHAAVSYAADTPMGIIPSKQNTPVMRKPVIPDIQTAGKSPMHDRENKPKMNVHGASAEKDYISYTVSAPSGRGTAMMSVDEHQVMSEGEQHDIPQDIAPLPDPPSRQQEQFDDGRPDSHVVVVPSQS